jgi:hypothetical protein
MAKHSTDSKGRGRARPTRQPPPWHPVYRLPWLRVEPQPLRQSGPPPSTWIETEIDVSDGDGEVRTILYRRRSRALPISELRKPSRGTA